MLEVQIKSMKKQNLRELKGGGGHWAVLNMVFFNQFGQVTCKKKTL